MCRTYLGSLMDNITLETANEYMMGSGNVFSLYSIIRVIIVEAAAQSMFGPHLHEIDMRVIEHMLNFNDNAWQVVMRYPDFFGHLAVSEPRKKMMAVMRKFVKRSREQNRFANSFVRNVLSEMESTGVDMNSRAAMMLLIFFA